MFEVLVIIFIVCLALGFLLLLAGLVLWGLGRSRATLLICSGALLGAVGLTIKIAITRGVLATLCIVLIATVAALVRCLLVKGRWPWSTR